mgnify:CR=1 FL=1
MQIALLLFLPVSNLCFLFLIMIILLVLDLPFKYMNIINMAVVYIALALTVISLIDYIAKNYKVFIEGSSK